MLKHHRDTQLTRLARTVYLNGLSVPENLPGVSLKQSVENLDKGAFSRTVFAQQCMHSTGDEIKINLIVSNTTGKCLGDLPHRYQRRCYLPRHTRRKLIRIMVGS